MPSINQFALLSFLELLENVSHFNVFASGFTMRFSLVFSFAYETSHALPPTKPKTDPGGNVINH